MNIKTVQSNNQDARGAVGEVAEQLAGFDFNVLIFFASATYDFHQIAEEMKTQYSDKLVLGCSSYSEFCNDMESKDTITAMAITKECVSDAAIEVIENVAADGNLAPAFWNFENHFDMKMSEASFRKYVGIMLTDGLSGAEEKTIEMIGDMTDVFFVGGSAADRLTFTGTYLYANGKVYQDAVVLALFKVETGFTIVKTQSVEQTGISVTVTKADPEQRRIYELNNKPAAEYLSTILDIPMNELQDSFFGHPLGIVIGDEIFIRSLRTLEPDGSISAFCAVAEGMTLSLLKTKDMIAETKASIEEKKAQMGSISGILNFNCVLRTLQLEKEQSLLPFGEIFADYPTCGFSTYGEIFLGHINQTATMLLFK